MDNVDFVDMNSIKMDLFFTDTIKRTGQKTLNKMKAAKGYASYFTTPLGVFRKIGGGFSDLGKRIHLLKPVHSDGIGFASNLTKIFSTVGLFFGLVTLVDTSIGMKQQIKKADTEGIVLSSFGIAGAAAGVVEKTISVAQGITSTLAGVGKFIPGAARIPAIARFTIPAGVTKCMTVAGKAILPLNTIMSVFGIVRGSIEMSRVVKVRNTVTKIQKELNAETVDTAKVVRLIDEAIDLTTQEDQAIQEKVQKMSQRALKANGKIVTTEEETKIWERLRAKKIAEKKACFARGSSAKALACMEEVKKIIDANNKLNIDRSKVVFANMRTLVNRRIVTKAMGLATDLVALGCIAVLFSPAAPFAPLFTLGAVQIGTFALGLYDRYGLSKGIDLDPKDLLNS